MGNKSKGKLINNKKVLKDRDRIWKFALLAYKEGMILDLDDEYKEEINIRNLNFEAEHPFYSRIEAIEYRSFLPTLL